MKRKQVVKNGKFKDPSKAIIACRFLQFMYTDTSIKYFKGETGFRYDLKDYHSAVNMLRRGEYALHRHQYDNQTGYAVEYWPGLNGTYRSTYLHYLPIQDMFVLQYKDLIFIYYKDVMYRVPRRVYDPILIGYLPDSISYDEILDRFRERYSILDFTEKKEVNNEIKQRK